MPPIAPTVTRVERYGGSHPKCGAHQISAVALGMEPGGSFGHRIAALVTFDWGRDLFAAVRSVVNPGKRQGLSAFESILAALNPLESLFPLS